MKSLKNYVIEKWHNSPDSIEVKIKKGKTQVFDFEDEGARPFIYVLKKSVVLFGITKETHSELLDDLHDSKPRLCKQLSIDKIGTGDFRYDPHDSWYDNYEEWANENPQALNIRTGRIWDITIDNKPALFIAWWDELSDKEFLDYNKNVIDNYFDNKFNLSSDKNTYTFYCVDNNGKIFEWSTDKKIKVNKRSKESEKLLSVANAIHLATQKEKNEFFANFKKTRDERNQKIYNHTKSKTEAEYRALKYQESLEQ